MPTAPTAQSSTQRAHLDASDKRGRAQRRLSWTGYFVALLATYQAASCGSDPPPSSIDDTASTSVTGTPIGIHPAMPHPWQYGIGGLGGGGGEPGGGGAGAAECVSAADCPAPPACFDAVCVDGECHETPAAIGSPCDDGDECAAEACTCVRSDACVPLTAQVQAFLTHHWRADAGSQAAPPLWTDMLGDRPFHGEVGTAPALGNDDETQRACWQFDGVDDRLVLDAGQLTSATTSRTWLWVRRVAGVTGATTYFLRSTNDHAETVGSIAGAGREYNVGLRTPAPGAGFLPFDLRPSHTRELAAEALVKTASTYLYYRDGELLGAAPVGEAGQLGDDALSLCSNNGSNAMAVDLFDLALNDSTALTEAQIQLWTQYADARYGPLQHDLVRSGTLMMFGDSITAAVVVDNGRGTGVNTTAYREALRGRLPGVTFVGQIDMGNTWPHEAVSGQRIDQMELRLPQALSANQADVLVVLGGTNDAAQGDSGATMLARMESFVAAAHAIAPQLVLRVVDLPPNTNMLIDDRVTAYNDGLDAVIATLQANHPQLDVARIVSGSEMSAALHLSQDGTHPNELGHRKLANDIASAIANLFPPQ